MAREWLESKMVKMVAQPFDQEMKMMKVAMTDELGQQTGSDTGAGKLELTGTGN